jgi:hypothetical protein
MTLRLKAFFGACGDMLGRNTLAVTSCTAVEVLQVDQSSLLQLWVLSDFVRARHQFRRLYSVVLFLTYTHS